MSNYLHMLSRPLSLKRRYFLVISLTISILIAGTVSFVRCHDKIGDPFMGFFFGNDLRVNVAQRSTWPGIKGGVQPLDRLVGVNGHRFDSAKGFTSYLWNLPRDAHLNIEMRRQTTTFNLSYQVPLYNLQDFLVIFVAPCCLGVIFLMLGCFVFFLRPRYRVSLVYFFFCALISLTCVILFESYSGFHLTRLVSLYPLIGAVAFHLFSLFPERNRNPILNRCVSANYVVVATLLVLAQLFANNEVITPWLTYINASYIALVIVAIFVMMGHTFISTSSQRSRDKIKVLFLGLSIASIMIGGWAIGFLTTHNRIFYLDQAMLLFLILPVFLGYAILKTNILDIDRVMRMGLSYGLLSASLLMLYLFVVTIIGRIAPGSTVVGSLETFLIFAILAGILIANSIGGVQSVVMRLMFKGRYNIISNLHEFTNRLSRAATKERIQTILAQQLPDSLGLVGGAFLAKEPEEVGELYKVVSTKNIEADEVESIDWSNLVKRLERFAQVVSVESLTNSDTLALDEAKVLRKCDIALIVKIERWRDDPFLLLLGERRGDKNLTHETLELLSALAKQAGIAIQNAEFFDKAAEQEKFAALGKVASIMVHEIKNPLGIIRVSAETIRKRLSRNETSYELATIIDEEVTRMNETIQQFLNFAKPDPLSCSPFNINELINDVVRRLKPDFDQVGVKLNTDLTETDQPFYADQEKLRRALYNLLLNAKEASKEQQSGEVELTTLFDDESLLLTVADDGKGIEEEARARIFQPFFTTKSGGTGLGLAIVKQIVEQHKGEIDVASEAGHGARFNVRLPISP